MSNGTEPWRLKTDVDRALREIQAILGLEPNRANLWPGTSAKVAAEIYRPILYEVISMVDRDTLTQEQAQRLIEIERAI